MFASQIRVVLYRRIALCCALGLIVGISSGAAQEAKQPQYKDLKVELQRTEANQLKVTFETGLRSPSGFGASEADAKKYLTGFYFPMMSQISPESLASLADARKKLFSQYIPQAATAGARDFLTDATFTYARGMARGNFHPAVRYNAVLMLGDLDQQLASGTNPPVPHAKATAELLELIEQQQFNKIAVPESVKLGALIGLERHTRYGIDPSLNERLTKAMIGVMASPTPEDVEPNVHDWLRSTAASVLANQYAKNPNKEVQAALTKLIADKTVNLDDRCTAAGQMKKITYAAGADIDGKATANAVIQLTLDVMTEAGKLAADYEKEAIEGHDFSSMREGGGGGRYGGYGGYGEEEDMGPRFERRQLFVRLHNIGAGGNSLKAGLADEDKTHIEELIAELAPLVQEMEDKNAVEVDVTRSVIAVEESLKNLVQGWGLPAAEAADAAEPAEGFAER
jgi:hypothetical protein